MARIDRVLTERELEAEWSRVKAAGGRTVLKAGPPRGLVVILTRQRAAFRYWFRVKGTSTKGLWDLGDFPRLTLKDARDEAAEVRKAARRGVDPREAERQERRQAAEAKREAVTVADLVGRFISSRRVSGWGRYGPLAKRSADEYDRCKARHLDGAEIGARPVRELRRIEAREWLDGITTENGPGMACTLHKLLRSATAWGLELELLDADPLSALKMPRARPRDRVLDDAELAAYWRALDAAPAMVAAVLRLQALTATRFPSELLSARWRHIDLAARRWAIPGELRKGGRPLVLPLSDAAVRLLRAVEKETGDDVRVFAPIKARSLVDYYFEKAEKAATREAFTPHDVRRSVSDGIVRLGFGSWPTADAILGHALKGSARTYIHTAPLVDMAAALERWGRHVEALAAGEARTGAEVVPLVRS